MNFEERFPKTHALLEQAKGDVFPSYAVGISSDQSVWQSVGGCGSRSLFDLASLTKVLCTTTLAALAEQRGILSLKTPVHAYFPAFEPEHVLLSHLLNHSSGLPAWLPLHEKFHSRTPASQVRLAFETEILKSWKAEEFEKACVYSDLGLMLLGWSLEKAAGGLLDALFHEWVAAPLGLADLQFLPVDPDVVPTENCPWRGHHLRGEVHDDNCFVLGGVAGHAGLFGNTKDVLRVGKLWLEAYLGHPNLITPDTARRYWTFTHVPGSTRTLGWDSPSRGTGDTSSAGTKLSAKARGHLGYTGTSLWIDPEQKLIITLLSYCFGCQNEKIKAFRPIFHDTLMGDLLKS